MRGKKQIRWWSLMLPTLLAIGLMAPAMALTQEMLPAASMGTAFTYQGRLTDDAGDPIDDTCDLRFILYDADLGGSQIGPVVTADDTTVTAGYFTVPLDFGSVFDGTALWLEVAVQCSGDPGYTVLSPRQALTAAPYALNADLLDGNHADAFAQAAHSHDAADIATGILHTDRFAAYSDLTAEGYLDNNADGDLLTRLQADSRFVNEGQSNSVTTGMITDGTIGQADIGSNAVGSDEIAADAVGSAEIGADAVGSAEIAAGAVGSSEIADNSVGRADLSNLFKAQYVRVNTVNANEYIWDDAWYSDNRPDIYTTGTAGQIYFDSHGGVQLHIVIIADGSKVVDTNAYTYTYTATDTDLLEIYVWPYTFIYQWFIHFVGARARYDASNDHIAGIVMAGTD